MSRTYSMKEAHTILNPPALIATENSRWANWPKGKPVPPPADNPTKSFWIEEFRHRLDNLRSTPQLPASADVVVIGTGMTGCSAVYHLTKSNPNLSIVSLDARAFCSGATGRNGGHCFRPEGWGFRALVQELGPEAALSVRRLYLKNRDVMQEFLDEHNLREKVDCTFKGGVHIFGSAEEREEHIEDLKLADELGLDHGSAVVDAQEMSKILQCHNLYGGMFTKKSGSFWPRKFCAETFEISMKQGQVNLQTNTLVTSVEPASEPGARWTVITPRGKINAKIVLHATNGYAGYLLPQLMGSDHFVAPARNRMVAVRPAPSPDSLGTWPVNVLVREGYHYLVQMPKKPGETKENLVVYGLHGSGPTADDTNVSDEEDGPLDDYRRFLAFTFPEKFSEVDEQGCIPQQSIEYDWSGIMGFTKDQNVVLGPVKGKLGQFTSVGYNGEGMVKCWTSGLVVTDMITWELSKSRTSSNAPQSKWMRPDWYPAHWVVNESELD